MNILVLNGSPRPKGHTKTMVNAFEKGATDAGHTVKVIDVCRKNIKGCLACEYCHTKGNFNCVQKDDMQEVYDALREANLLVLASPIYYHNLSGQLKCVIDRFYATGMKALLPKLKQVAMFLASGDEDIYDGALYSLKGDFEDFLGLENIGVFTVHGEEEVSEEKKQELYEFGRNLKEVTFMNDFIFHNPDKVYFGKNQFTHLAEEVSKYGKKVLMVYGGGSIKKNGLYDQVTKLLTEKGLEIFELAGVEPNPRHTTVDRGAEICKQEGIDVVLAVGGGSTIDCSKGIAAAAKTEDGKVWPLVEGNVWVTDALPIIAILTNAATGSEMDAWAVISNMDVNVKIGIGGDALIPKAAFENPELTYSLPAYQTACGAFDIFNHVLDNYYLAGDATFDMVLEMQEAVMRAVVKWTPVALAEPENYEARANLMWASSMALNTILDAGTVHAPACHAMEHELSAYYDITHGHGLAIVTPRWLKYILDESTAPAIYRLGTHVFGVEAGLDPMDGAKKAIEAVEHFAFDVLGLKKTLTELNINEEHFVDMAKHASMGAFIPGIKNLNQEDIVAIYKMCL
ncbi:NADH-dependent butanol dehydrogenase A [Lachnospiraceae bacterium TWA4]|nr:NADH-dependent butanol dehydrogenase A [Lachnospiraceae bacterium TWA4]